MGDFGFLVPILLAIRVVVDLAALSRGGTSYRLEFAYFLLFFVSGVVILGHSLKDVWGYIAIAMALFSIGLFFAKRARREHNDSNPAT
jgi:hypothetical protein